MNATKYGLKWGALAVMSAVVFSGGRAEGQIRTNISVDIDLVYDELAAHGEWISNDAYGWVWVPSDMSPDWRPYTKGRWVYCNEYGWVWRSSMDWGWATFHYGRWYFDPFYGWAWVPGTEWGPAWVAWRSDGEHVGWAPLPPKVKWRAGFGLEIGDFDIDVEIGSSDWSFINVRHIHEPDIHRHVVLGARNVTLIRHAPVITRYVPVGNRVVNLSLSVERIERLTGRPVPRLQFIARSQPSRRSSVEFKDRADRTLEVYQPQIIRQDRSSGPRVVTRRSYQPSEAARRRALKDKLEREYRHRTKEALEAIHRREAVRNASNASREAILKRQAAERSALDQEYARRRELLKRQAERENARRSVAPRSETRKRSAAGGTRKSSSSKANTPRKAAPTRKPSSSKGATSRKGGTKSKSEGKKKPQRKKKDKN